MRYAIDWPGLSREEMDALLALAQKGIAELVELQKQVLSTPAAGGA